MPDAPYYVPLGKGKQDPSHPTHLPKPAPQIPDVSYIIQLLEEISSKIETLEERLNDLTKSDAKVAPSVDIPQPTFAPITQSSEEEEV